MICPRAYKDAPHEMRQDEQGRWFCPIELDAEREKAYKVRQAEIADLEALWVGSGTGNRSNT